MTDHTAIIERMARAMCEAQGFKWEDLTNFMRSPGGGHDEREYYLHAAQAALSASGLLEVLEKAEGAADWMEQLRASGDAGFWDWSEGDEYSALRNAIKGVRDGK